MMDHEGGMVAPQAVQRQRQIQRPEPQLIGRSTTVRQIRGFIERTGLTGQIVFLHGESGTGKDLVARLIHERGRGSHRFIVVDCGALTETLAESELFGQVRGSFTDARDRKGLVSLADGGTLFFNEVGNMGPYLQKKFLGILDGQPFRAVGGEADLQVNARIIAATNTNLEKAVRDGRFRADLYHRLTVITFELPPLRERREDIPHLAYHFLKQCANGNGERRFSDQALAVMSEYDWPGNVRELKNVVERVTFITGDVEEINADIVRPHLKGVSTRAFPTFAEAKRQYFIDVLALTGGIQADAAELASISQRQMSYAVRIYQLLDYVARLKHGEIRDA